MMASAEAELAYAMEPLATLPVFFKLDGRVVVLAGASPPAVWKAELLAAAGGRVQVYDDAPSPEMRELASRLGPGRLTLLDRSWRVDDLLGAALALGAIEDDTEAARFRAAAQSAGVPVNVIDKPAFCDFQFGTILARSPIVIGISTDGAAPVFGQALRSRIEAVLPADLGLWARAAKAWRPAIQALKLDFRGRRRFWEAFSRYALAGNDPSEAVRQACLTEAQQGAAATVKGSLVLVGSGMGTPDSMTLRSIATLQTADVVIHDPDVSPAAIGLARREADKRASDRITPAEIADIARLKTVAWLGTGDPHTCCRWRARRVDLDGAMASPSTTAAPAICPTCPEGCRFRAPLADASLADRAPRV